MSERYDQHVLFWLHERATEAESSYTAELAVKFGRDANARYLPRGRGEEGSLLRALYWRRRERVAQWIDAFREANRFDMERAYGTEVIRG